MGLLPPKGVMRVTARVLLLALSVTTLGPMLHGAHDPDLAPVIVAHDAHQPWIQTTPVAPDSAGDHCLACHFVRSSRGPASWQATGLYALTAGNLLAHTNGELALLPSVAPLPARAPPLA
jgi:hypothetical protein